MLIKSWIIYWLLKSGSKITDHIASLTSQNLDEPSKIFFNPRHNSQLIQDSFAPAFILKIVRLSFRSRAHASFPDEIFSSRSPTSAAQPYFDRLESSYGANNCYAIKQSLFCFRINSNKEMKKRKILCWSHRETIERGVSFRQLRCRHVSRLSYFFGREE